MFGTNPDRQWVAWHLPAERLQFWGGAVALAASSSSWARWSRLVVGLSPAGGCSRTW